MWIVLSRSGPVKVRTGVGSGEDLEVYPGMIMLRLLTVGGGKMTKISDSFGT